MSVSMKRSGLNSWASSPQTNAGRRNSISERKGRIADLLTVEMQAPDVHYRQTAFWYWNGYLPLALLVAPKAYLIYVAVEGGLGLDDRRPRSERSTHESRVFCTYFDKSGCHRETAKDFSEEG